MFAYNEGDEKAGSSSMTLSEEEVQWTHNVKAAALENESLKRLSDYEYAQHALFNHGNVEKSLFQIEGMQQFREEYNINDTVEEGMALFRQFHERHPWLLLDIGYVYEHESFVLVYDYVELKPASIKDWRVFLGGFYYTFQMVTSNLQSIREGVVFVGEVQGMGWQNVSIDFTRTFWEHLFRFYSMNFKEISWVGNSVFGNIFESLHRSIMHERGWNIQIGVKNEDHDGRLDTLFKVPSPEIAYNRLLEKCQTLLTKRLHHHQSYHLPPALTEEDILFRIALEEIEAAVHYEELEAGINQDSEDDYDDEHSEDGPEPE